MPQYNFLCRACKKEFSKILTLSEYEKGVVVCPEPLAALAGAHVFRLGGSAIDAAIATAFAQTVVSPAMTTIAGNGIMNVFHAPTGRHQLVDFMGYAGARATAEMYERAPAGAQHRGYASVVVPTLVRGLHTALFASRPLAGLLRDICFWTDCSRYPIQLVFKPSW